MKKEKQLKIAAWVSAGISAGFIVYMIAWKWIIPKFFLNVLKHSEAASIGIIGGADGPTAIYLTTKLPNESVTVLLMIGFALLTAAFVFLMKASKKK